MKKLIAILLFLGLFFPNINAGEYPSLLWRVSGKGLEKSSYLYGTMHSSNEEIFTYVDSIRHYISLCDVFANEIDMTEMDASSIGQYKKALMLPKNKELKDYYSPQEYKFVKAELSKHLGPLAFGVYELRPIWISSMLGLSEDDFKEDENGDRLNVLDDILQKYAMMEELDVVPLETANSQMKALSKISIEEQADDLLFSLENWDESSNSADDLFEAYAKCDLDACYELFKSGTTSDDFAKYLLDDRNDLMVKKIKKILKPKDEALFCAVGALHLPGESGLINQLRALGYTVEPVMYFESNDQ